SVTQFIVAGYLHHGFNHTEDTSPYGTIESRFYSRFGVFHRLAQPQPLYPAHFMSTSDFNKHQVGENCVSPVVSDVSPFNSLVQTASGGLSNGCRELRSGETRP